MNWKFVEAKHTVAGPWGGDHGASWDEAKHTVAGPWGGDRGSPWDDGVYETVRQVVITSSADAINSIQFEYDKNNRSAWCEKHGGDHGVKTDKIKLDYPSELVIAISGRCGYLTEAGGPVIIKSLCFESNRRKYGPFGIEKGTPFSFAVSGAKLVGFYGRSSSYLDSIGAYVKPLIQKINPLETHKNHIGRNVGAPIIVPPPGHGGGPMTPPPSGYPGGQMIPYNPGHAGQQYLGNPDAHMVFSPAPPVTAYPPSSKKFVSFGPWGGDGGSMFDDGIYTGVREIVIKRTGGLVAIRVCYDHNGKPVWGSKNGGTGGLKVDKIVFDYPFEVLTQITGYYGSTILRGPTIIKSLTFHTNKRSYGPFGDQQGFSFSSGSRGAIVGFHGRNGYFVNAIGVHVVEGMPLNSNPPISYPDPFNTPALNHREVVWGLPRGLEPSYSEPALSETGPWGGDGGTPFDDGVYKGIRKIILTRGDAICSIQTEYDRNGIFVWSTRHGTANDDSSTYQVKFDYPYEVLTSISGYYDNVAGDWRKKVIRSLTFHTNKTKYGPYGKTVGTYFSSGNKDGKIVGFHGRSSWFLDAIGVHVKYWERD